MTSKQNSIVFRVDDQYLSLIDSLAEKLGLDRSKAIRVGVDDAVEKYVSPGFKGEITVLPFEHFRDIVNSYESQLQALEHEKERWDHVRSILCSDEQSIDGRRIKDLIEGIERGWDKKQAEMRADRLRRKAERDGPGNS